MVSASALPGLAVESVSPQREARMLLPSCRIAAERR